MLRKKKIKIVYKNSFKILLIFWLFLLFLGVGGVLGVKLFDYYKQDKTITYYIPVKDSTKLPTAQEAQNFLKVELLSSSNSGWFKTKIQDGREYITNKTFIETQVPVLESDTVYNVYKVSMDAKVKSDEKIKAQVENSFTKKLEGNSDYKYISINFTWDNTVLVDGQNQTNNELRLTAAIKLDYEGMKKDDVIKQALTNGKTYLTLTSDFTVTTLE